MPALPLDLCLSGGEVTDPLARPGGRWVSGILTTDSTTGGSSVLCMWAVDGTRVVDLLSDPVPQPGRGSSGGVHVWNHAADRVHAVTRTDGIVEIALAGDEVVGVARTALSGERSWSTPSLSADGRSLYAVADWSELWRLDLEGGGAELIDRVHDGFMMDADGPARRCMVWNRPHMSWTQSAILGAPELPGVSVQQPRSTRDGSTRGFITDAGGFANIVIEEDAHMPHQTVIDDDCEHAGPVWGPGQRSWCPSPDGRRIAFTRNDRGFGSLWILDRTTGVRTMIGRGVHGCLSWEGDTLVAYRTGARTPPQVVVYDMASPDEPRRTVLVEPGDPRWRSAAVGDHLVEPTLQLARSHDGVDVPYRLFRSAVAHGGLLVWIHGGPVDQWQVSFRPRHSYWLSRGWSIAVVDHRGTTGWGRRFVEALEGHWGDADARDTVAVIEHAHGEHGFDAATTVLVGASAGGLTVLNAARLAPRLVAGAVMSYPVVDLADMLVGDDPFESHYMPRLIGAVSRDDAMLRARSPHLHASQLSNVPLLVFHGDADYVVPVSHSRRLTDAVVAAGGTCRLVVFEGEGHGFRLRGNLEREFAETGEFLESIAR